MLPATLSAFALFQSPAASELQVDVLRGETILEGAAVLQHRMVRQSSTVTITGTLRFTNGDSTVSESVYSNNGAFIKTTRRDNVSGKAAVTSAILTKGGREVAFTQGTKRTNVAALERVADPSVAWFGKFPRVGTKVTALLPVVQNSGMGKEVVQYKGIATVATFVGQRRAHHVSRVGDNITQNYYYEASGRLIRMEVLVPGQTITAALRK
ncbi:MAG: hypothetical protein MUC92_05295 [Fimbriimonadaceae bacterium]|jgi:hypothetical protein|nr:hypothetical protein [Fimbriimonadaceae bacterium]